MLLSIACFMNKTDAVTLFDEISSKIGSINTN